ncbi:crotonase/enoyl-CoA hydratase family protein [Microvirga zambiensis]|uniref:crotonase/enoyl-CoA hydratase family protein n=1 Tax=Microvirga zambiensis TaxID=1402137 RepID=UPI00191E5632|nr:crotonase/enoyl-CoA hydratase family protein [Microvirga zambiensis]
MIEDNGDGRINVGNEGFVRLIGIDRPAKLNGVTPKMLREYAVAMTEFDRDPEARCALIYAEGANFTAGLDLPKLAEVWARGESVFPKGLLDPWNLRPPFRRKPVVMAIKGICFTVGVEMMLSADIVIAANNCRFSQMEVKRGIMAGGGATIRMVERAGWGNAMRYLLTGDEWDAETSLRFNFVQEVVPAGQEFTRAREIAVRIVETTAPLAVEATIENARTALLDGPASAVTGFDAINLRLRRTEDAREGVVSFREKRPPKFKGH